MMAIQTSKERQNLAAVLGAPKERLTTVSRPIPTPGPSELVVRNYAIAANPVDWKMQDYGFAIKEYPTVLGSDACGVVTAIGPSVTRFQVGDRVTGFAGVIVSNDLNHGAWQTYTILKEIATMKIPDHMTYEEGSVFPMGMATAGMALFYNLGIPRPSRETSAQQSGFLVWGASSSVGSSAVQLARNLGFRVFATASPAHHQYLRSLGAFEVFDYRDPDVVDKIAASARSAGTPIHLGFDTITEGDTAQRCADIVLACGGEKLVLVGPWPSTETKPEGIEISMPLAAKLFTDQAQLGAWLFNEYLQNALSNGSIVPAPRIEVAGGGIAAAQKALDRLKAGVSGRKLVVTLADAE